MGTSASWTEGVCLRWMRQANSQAAAIREQEGFGKRKGADGGGAMAQKRPYPSASFAPPIAGSPSTSRVFHLYKFPGPGGDWLVDNQYMTVGLSSSLSKSSFILFYSWCFCTPKAR